jgi:hypothetical protein
MFRRRLRPVDVDVEQTAVRLRAALATSGPGDEKIGHHRTYEGNRDATRVGLAVVGRPVDETATSAPLAPATGRVLRLPRARRRPSAIAALAGAKQAARG